jgi:hypothetical protein
MRAFALMLLASAAFILPASSPAQARDYLTVGAGYFNPFDTVDNAMWYEAEYRGNYLWNKFRPLLGVGGNNDGVVYAYAGVDYDWNVYGHWYLIPSVAIGYYERGGGKDLGGPKEFRPSIEADYQFDSGWRAGVALHHISNAKTYSINPGVEMVEATISIPVSSIAGMFER